MGRRIDARSHFGALETCCRQGEMLRIQNRHVDWERHQIAIPGAHAKDSENRRVPFDPQGRCPYPETSGQAEGQRVRIRRS